MWISKHNVSIEDDIKKVRTSEAYFLHKLKFALYVSGCEQRCEHRLTDL